MHWLELIVCFSFIAQWEPRFLAALHCSVLTDSPRADRLWRPTLGRQFDPCLSHCSQSSRARHILSPGQTYLLQFIAVGDRVKVFSFQKTHLSLEEHICNTEPSLLMLMLSQPPGLLEGSRQVILDSRPLLIAIAPVVFRLS